MADNNNEQNSSPDIQVNSSPLLTDPEKETEKEKTSFLNQVQNTAKEKSQELKEQAEKYKDKAQEVIDNAQNYAVKNAERFNNFINNIVFVTISLFLYGIHASALCYLSMSVNVNKGLGGVKLSGPPFKPPRFSINKCPEPDDSRSTFESIRQSLKEFGFPYRNAYSCDMFSMIKESFINVRFARWASNAIAFSYSSGRKGLNGVFSFFSDPILAFYVFPLFVPLIVMISTFFGPIMTAFAGVTQFGDISPTNFFGLFALNPLSQMLTIITFMFGLFAVPLGNAFAMLGSVMFFFTIFPYILNDKFIFPNDSTRKAYKGFDFIWQNLKYRWEGMVLVWLVAIANTAKSSLDTEDDLKGKVISIDNKKLKAKVVYNSGSVEEVDLKNIEVDSESYLQKNARVEVKTNPLGTNSKFGVIRKVDIQNKEKIFEIFVENKGKEDEILKGITKDKLVPVITEKNKREVRINESVIVNSKSTIGSTAQKFIYMIALGWLIWIIFRHKASYVVLSIVLFVVKFIIDYQFTIALVILLGVGGYFAFMYKDELKDVSGKLIDKAEDAAKKAAKAAKAAKKTAKAAKKEREAAAN